MYEEQWYSTQEKERPFWKGAASHKQFATIANRTFDIALVYHLDRGWTISFDGYT